MTTFYIYEIQGVKIGCTTNVEHRMKEQGYEFSDAIILEEHTCIYTVSDREIELQKENGYPVDTIPYWKAVQNRRKWTGNEHNWTKEASRKGGFNSKSNKLTPEQELEVVSKYIPRKYSQYKLAEEYGVGQPCINAILKRHKA